MKSARLVERLLWFGGDAKQRTGLRAGEASGADTERCGGDAGRDGASPIPGSALGPVGSQT